MKFPKVLLIMLIGMISLTAFATTSEPARKLETTIVQRQFDAVAVVNVEATTLQVVNAIVIVNVVSIAAENNYLTYPTTFATVMDVGWQTSGQFNFCSKRKKSKYCNSISPTTDTRIRVRDIS